MKRFLLPILGSGLLLLSACGTEDGGPGVISTTAPMEAKYSTTDGIIPFPNNILFSGSTNGKLNFKDATTDVTITDITDPKGAMNQLDGFSTIAPITTTFGLPIESTTITSSSVRVFEVAAGTIQQGYGVGAITGELAFGVQFKALVSPSDPNVLVVKPVVPLKSDTNYMVIVTNALKSTSGEGAQPSALFMLLKHTAALVDPYTGASQVPGRDDATAASLEDLRQLTQAMLIAAGPVGAIPLASPIAAKDVAVAWSFKTQTLGTTLAAIQTASVTDTYARDPLNLEAFATAIPAATFAAGVGLPIAAYSNLGSVVTGAVKLPYYLDDTSLSSLAPLVSTFQVDSYGMPAVKSVQNVNYLLTIPNTVGPWPVVIFQHGFTVDKSAVFGVANTLAGAGFATIAIDAVLHGDRTFGIDVVTQVLDPVTDRYTTTEPVPDGVADSSGTHYLNLTSLLTSRDNIRQSVADLIHLVDILKVSTLDVVANATGAPGVDVADLDLTVPITYVGHSNGGILGAVLAGVEPTIVKYVLANPGGDYASILQNSEAYGPVVDAGLAAKDVVKDSADYNAFFVAAQTVVDDGDPLNYVGTAATKSVFLLKTTPDGVVPNPQTDILSLNLGLKQVSGNAATVTANVWPLSVVAPPLATNGFVNYISGTHSTFLTPSGNPDPVTFVKNPIEFLPAYTAMQTDTVGYLSSGSIDIYSTAVTE